MTSAQLKQACLFVLEGATVPDRYLKAIAQFALEKLREEDRDGDPDRRA